MSSKGLNPVSEASETCNTLRKGSILEFLLFYYNKIHAGFTVSGL